MKKTLFIILTAILVSLSAAAQSPIRWRASVKMTSQTEGIITIKALISDGWHLYGFEMPTGGPKPTRFDFSNSDGIEIEGDIKPSESPIYQMDPLFGKRLSWWDRNVIFTQRFKLKNKKEGKESRMNVSVSFMSCNGESCTPPKTESMSVVIPQYNPSQITQ